MVIASLYEDPLKASRGSAAAFAVAASPAWFLHLSVLLPFCFFRRFWVYLLLLILYLQLLSDGDLRCVSVNSEKPAATEKRRRRERAEEVKICID